MTFYSIFLFLRFYVMWGLVQVDARCLEDVTRLLFLHCVNVFGFLSLMHVYILKGDKKAYLTCIKQVLHVEVGFYLPGYLALLRTENASLGGCSYSLIATESSGIDHEHLTSEKQ